MQAYNHLLRALRRSTITAGTTAAATNTIIPSFGGWQMLPGSNISRLMAKAGYEWVCVDMEHGNIDGKIRIQIPNVSLIAVAIAIAIYE